MKRVALAAILAAVACTIVFARTGTFSTFAAPAPSFKERGPLYTTEQERLVSAIAGSILNIAAFADRFDAGDPFHVRNILPAGKSAKFTVARRAEVFTVEVPGHVWAPRSYGRLARSFMADGAGAFISEDLARDHADVSVLVDLSADGLRQQNVRLSGLLQQHPRSAAIHERAALLLGAAARRHVKDGGDARALLCRMTAHLAVARALHDGALSADGDLAEKILSGLAGDEAAESRVGETAWVDGPVTFGERPRLEIVPADPAGGSTR